MPTEARRLEDEAIEAGEETEKGRELRGRAAALRVRALGERVYPVLVCSKCFTVTGWLDAQGECDGCLRAAALRAAFTDPRAGWVDVGAPSPEPSETEERGGHFHVTSLVHARESRRRMLVEAWIGRVDPDGTGPIAPEEGYEIEVARRDELDAADGSGVIVRFRTARSRFVEGSWIDGASSDIASRDLLVPAEFPASLPAEQLVEAWGDFRDAVTAVNRRRWEDESARREAKRQADAAAADALREQRGVSDLLDES